MSDWDTRTPKTPCVPHTQPLKQNETQHTRMFIFQNPLEREEKETALKPLNNL